MKSKANTMDPYRILFPLGLLHGFMGAFAWILFALNFISYPGQNHPQQMVGGFLLSFASGFLMTAVPRFTGAKPCGQFELLVAAALSFGAVLIPSPYFSLLLLLFLSLFFVKRFLARSYSPPVHFLFLPIGLLLGIVGALGMVNGVFLGPARTFLYYGTMLSFLLGIGAKLIAALLGWAPLPTQQIQDVKKFKAEWQIPALQAALFLSGYAAELFSAATVGRGLRAFVSTWIAVQYWHLFSRPKASGKLPFWIWISAWNLILGLWVHALFPSLGMHAAHLFFIGGFGLMTLLVASRVTLAHGGYPPGIESQSRIFPIVSSLILLASLTRFISPWSLSYTHHLAYAAVLWIAGILSWGVFFLPKIRRQI